MSIKPAQNAQKRQGAVGRHKGSLELLRPRKRLTICLWFLLFYSDVLRLDLSRGMELINRTTSSIIVRLQKKKKKTHFKLFQAPGSHARIHSQSSSDRPAPAHSFLPSQHWRPSLSFSGHAPYLQSQFHESSEVETLLAPNELAEEVTVDCSNEFDMNFLNASSGRDANVAVSNMHTASRELPDDVSSIVLGQDLYDQCSIS